MKPIQRIIDDYCEEHGVSKYRLINRKIIAERFTQAGRTITQLAFQEGHYQAAIAYELSLDRAAIHRYIHS